MSGLATSLCDQDRALTLLSELVRDGSDLIARAQQLAVPASGRAWIRLVDTSAADAWLIAWNPGSHVGSHDHGRSRGAVHVLRGTLVETYRTLHDRRDQRVHMLTPGTTLCIPRNRVHDVANHGPTLALSVHAYFPKLTTMTFHPPNDSSRE